jgi:hypothetical protein
MTCKMCNGTGFYIYDHNHGKICEGCCKHPEGFFRLGERYDAKTGMWCCRTGCGYIAGVVPTEGNSA